MELEMASYALVDAAGNRLFPSVDDLACFEDSRVVDAILDVARPLLDIVSPTPFTHYKSEWMHMLTKGAGDVTNQRAAVLICHCRDISQAGRVLRPDRYFGVPMSELTYGQWWAFEAARAVLNVK